MKKPFKYCVSILVLLFLLRGSYVFAENSQLFNNIKVKDGLPSNEIFKITQDEFGFMWFATNNGFVRYDGYNMLTYRKNKKGDINLPNNQVTSIENADDLGLWIGTYEGLTYFNNQTTESKLIDLGEKREIRCVYNQGDSILWAGSSEGLFKIKTTDLSYKIYNQQNSNLGSNIIRALYLDQQNQLWIGTFDGLNVIRENGTMEHFNLKGNYKPELKNNLILAIQPYSAQNDSMLWIGSETGLVLFNKIKGSFEVYNLKNTSFDNEVIKCIFTKEPGNVYVGTDFGFYNLNITNDQLKSSFHDPFNNYSIANNVVWDIFEDNSGILWLATSNGISKLNFDQSMFQFTPVYSQKGKDITGTQVNDIYTDKNETIWLATKQGVVALFKNGNQKIFTDNGNPRQKLVLNNINTISGDFLGRIWIGSAGGINIWDPSQNKMYTITADFDLNSGLRSNYISAFIAPNDGSFWVTTWGGGMYKVKGDFSNPNNMSFNYVANFNTNVFSSSKKIWLKHDNKIFSIDLTTQAIKSIDDLNEYLKNEVVSSLHVSSKGILWIGTHNVLIQYNIQTHEITEFNVQTGNDSDILNLLEDHNGNIWGSTLTSIFKFSPQTNDLEIFPKNEGIPLDNFLYESNAISTSGKLFFGGNDGFISFNPDQIKKNAFESNTVITDLKVNNKSIYSLNELGGKNKTKNQITYSKKLNLKYDQHSFSIGFSTLHFGASERNIYAYQLVGFDKDWNYTSGSKNFASYSNLSSGKYEFLLRGSNNDGVWFDKVTKLNIVVKAPIWASPVAIVIYILILQLTLIALIITYRNKTRWKGKIKAITQEKEKNEELSMAKQQFFTNISHEFRTPLSLIIGPIESLLTRSDADSVDNKMLQMVQKNSKRLLSLVNQLLDIRKIENKTLKLKFEEIDIIELCQKQYQLFFDLAESHSIDYQFNAGIKQLFATSDATKLESIVQNLLSNAFKYTPDGGTISLHVDLKKENQLNIKVSDTGIGIAPDTSPNIFKRFYQVNNSDNSVTGYGIGLNIAKEYCDLMQGKIYFESEPREGTQFFVELPLVNSIAEKQIDASPIKQIYKKEESVSINTNTFNPLSNSSTILVVDDNPDSIEFLKLNLSDEYVILSASNAIKAFNILETKQVNLIISDVMMPDMDGIEFCEKVKKHAKYNNIPLILLTAKSLETQKVEGYKAGADAYITKPFDLELLKAQIENLLLKNKQIDDFIKRNLILENQEVEIKSADEKLLQETIQYINKHISDAEINLDKMCKSIGVSHSSLYRKVKAQTGMTLNELIRNIKLKKAAQLIKAGKLSISEIMNETGFTSHSYFAKCFKKVYKTSPREYAHK